MALFVIVIAVSAAAVKAVRGPRSSRMYLMISEGAAGKIRMVDVTDLEASTTNCKLTTANMRR